MQFELDRRALREVAAQSEPGLLDGKRLSHAMIDQISAKVMPLRDQEQHMVLAVVQVGDDPASEVYVAHKMRACARAGLHSRSVKLPVETTQAELALWLHKLSEDPLVQGILLQLPLPSGLDEIAAVAEIDPLKDVDGLHPANLGMLMLWQAPLEPCTPRGIMTLLDAYEVDLRGKRALVIGRSMLVGRPMAHMLMRADATVTVAHRHTRALESLVREAEVLVVAAGVPELVPGAWVREGAVVVDVGINATFNAARQRVIVGDVGFQAARERARLITPVPGGVGPMTVATLIENTARAALARLA